ncbi:RNA polymerase sigma factor [Alteromonas sp. a30]|uniref:RNA polymerase sigma factor n=1 Tax=Alteromonas sp. a30 TaxID=2730917 RepID=UPI002281CCF7|nr:sigma-70 family RNA polymerase sigma factor [Alteromonas sp. a30]MCY7296023.1 sigma-70 family RNA polymerase sigma factor [Alteromonas sp. a30]
MFEQSDEQLIKKALKGNKTAWLNLVKRYEKSVFNYGLRMTSNKDDALDLMQEVFISVHKSLLNYSGEGTFRAWLFRIASFRCVEFYRRKRPMQELSSTDEPVCEAVLPESFLISQQQNRELIEAMQGLPINQKAVVELKFFGHFTFAEIAEQLDISTNTVKSRLYTALDKLKIILEDSHASAR